MKDYSDKLSKLNFIEVFNYFSCKCCTPEYGLAAFSTGATPKTEEKKHLQGWDPGTDQWPLLNLNTDMREEKRKKKNAFKSNFK